MAFISGTEGLARQSWPQGTGILVQDAHLDSHTLPPSRVVPLELDELADWMFVELEQDGRRGRVYVKEDDAGERKPSELVIRIQGIVHDANLSMTGTWDRTEDNAKKAVQRLSLVSGGCKAAFEPQWKALANIRDMVCTMLGLCSSGRPTQPGTINLRRRVFTKVTAGNADTDGSTVKRGEDPSGTLARMSSRWRIASRLRCGVQNEDGDINHFNPLLIRVGDLVDVSASVAVVLRKTPFGRKCDVFFKPCTVVRLQAEGRMNALLHPREERHAISHVASMKAKGKMGEGFSFRGEPDKGSSVGGSGTA